MNVRSASALALLPALAAVASAQNLVVNGDFELGTTGVISDYAYVPFAGNATAQVSEGKYTVGDIVPPSYGDWAPFHDHTTGLGNLLSANGAPSPDSAVWSQTIAVQPNTDYRISFFLAEISTPASLASIDVRQGLLSLGSFQAPSAQDVWEGHTLTWNSRANTVLALSLHDLNTAGSYNDFALDDISVQAVPEPTTLAALGLGAVALLRRRRR